MELSDGSRVCLDCDRLFVINDAERRYFDDHHLTQPKRCKTCRQLRKDLRHQADVERAMQVLGVVPADVLSPAELFGE